MINAKNGWTTFFFYFTAYMAAWAMYEDAYVEAGIQLALAVLTIVGGTVDKTEEVKEKE